MKSMQKLIIAAAFAGLFAVSAPAQTYAQPVREIDRDARSAVNGNCALTLAQGDGYFVSSPCSVVSQGATLAQGPAGKVLVVQDVSLECIVPIGQHPRRLALGNSLGYQKLLPWLMQGITANGASIIVSSVPANFYVYAQRSVLLEWTLIEPVTGSAYTSCSARFAGHFVSLQ